ncbi:putative ABC transport system ATP-binding protein [Actinoplanes tereljensis]|uniref:Multidrug ABC transporter ATP-binding protein n=1 Tax=Paractinoplanes tereljensis TaxID=571912 RepID=A0A919TUQ4_9ACTN|nr:ABC transporter ATP-binding protein [Actinoplanes tereljensis]GIF23076.1 multidrug ABC transporter ATP-binding protein [Actinoplanes tereljensis]
MPRERRPGRTLLRRAIAGQARRVGISSVLSAAHQGGEALVPILIGVIIDQAVGTGTIGDLVVWIAVLGAAFVVLSASFQFGTRTGEYAVERAAHTLRLELTARILHPRGSAETGRLPGALVNVATGDAQRVGMVNLALPLAVAAFSGVVVGAIALLRMSVPLGLLVLIGAPVLLLAAHWLGKPLQRRSESEQEYAAQAAGVAADLVAGLRVLKGIGAESSAARRYRRISRESLTATQRAATAKSWHDSTLLGLTGVFLAIVALVGGRLAASGQITIGELVAAVGLAQFLLGPLALVAWANGEFAQARASADRIAAVLSTAPRTPGGDENQGPVRGHLRLTGVESAGLRGLTLDVEPGELLGVVLADQVGATTLAELLGRTRDPDRGTVELDGRPLHTLDPVAVRTAVLVAEHDADLFEGTLHDNVSLGRASADAVKTALDEVARTLPDDVDGVIAARGHSLSGGQRQRVALARSLAADPPVLVLHDPTTAVDSVTEQRIAAGIRELRRGRTTVLLTTSPSLLSVADRVVFLADGTVRASGTHADLTRDDDRYRSVVLS